MELILFLIVTPIAIGIALGVVVMFGFVALSAIAVCCIYWCAFGIFR
ncbi:hypothetical protein [Necropsobacter massiliensis]|nr:hypothetical protein [Necropsobacter massiliensis]